MNSMIMYFTSLVEEIKNFFRNRKSVAPSVSGLLSIVMCGAFMTVIWEPYYINLIYMDLDGIYIRVAATYSSALCGLFSSLLWARAAVRYNDIGSNVAAAGFTGAAVLFTLGANSNPEKIDEIGNILFSYSRYIGIYLGMLFILALFADEILRWKNEYPPASASKSFSSKYCKKYDKDNRIFSWPYFFNRL